MNFLFPAMLAGLAALAVPVILHLIARHRFSVQELPTIRFLDKQERTNVLAPKLVDPWQLLLRLLVLILLVLAMGRWFAGWKTGAPAPRNVILVVDTSASMRMELPLPGGAGRANLLEHARRHARTVIADLGPGSRCGLIADRADQPADLAPTTETAGITTALEKLEAIDGSGRGLVRAVADACDQLRGRREVKSHVIVLTDLRATAFQNRDQQALERITAAQRDLGKALEILFVDLVGQAPDNFGIVSAEIRGGDAKVGEDAHLLATVLNSSATNRTAKLRLSVSGRKEPLQRAVNVPANSRAVVDLTARANRSMQTVAQAELEGDSFPGDDTMAVPLNVLDARRVLIVNGVESLGDPASAAARAQVSQLSGDAARPAGAAPARVSEEKTIDGATILRFAFNPGREMGLPYGTGIDATLTTPDALAAQPLSKYEFIVLYDVTSLSERAMDDLRTYVEQGRSLLIFCSETVNAVNFNRTLASGGKDRPPLAPAQVGNDKPFDQGVGFRLGGELPLLLAPFRDPLKGDLSVVRFQKLREILSRQELSTVLLAGSGGEPLAIEMPLGRGRVVLATFGLELARGNLARTRVFPSLLWRLTDYLTGRLRQRPADRLVALRPAVLEVSEPAFALVQELELTPVAVPVAADAAPAPPAPKLPPSQRLKVGSDATVLVPALSAGRYQLHKPRGPGETGPILGYSRFVTVHADPAESDWTPLDATEVPKVFGSTARVTGADALSKLAPTGGELTRALIIALLLFYLIEAVAGWIASVRKERRRTEEVIA